MGDGTRTCPSCGKKVNPESSTCPRCGAALGANSCMHNAETTGGEPEEKIREGFPLPENRLPRKNQEKEGAEDDDDDEDEEETEEQERPIKGPSPKNRGTVGLLCLFFGIFGIHRFYAGRPISGLIQLLTFGLFGFWSFIDLLLCITGKFKDGKGLRIER